MANYCRIYWFELVPVSSDPITVSLQRISTSDDRAIHSGDIIEISFNDIVITNNNRPVSCSPVEVSSGSITGTENGVEITHNGILIS